MAEVDSLAIKIGADTGDIDKAFDGLFQTIARLDAALKEFAQGAESGFKGAQQTADAAQTAGTKQTEGMKQLVKSTKDVGKQASATATELQQLGNRWGGFVGGIVTQFAVPLTAALSVGAIVNNYTGDVAKVAQMSGRWTGQMEEWRKKRELLSRVTKEDVELYRKGKLAMLDFNLAMAGLSTTIMRALNPVTRQGIKFLHSISDWIRQNENNIVRFLKIAAVTITAVLIPAVVWLKKEMLMAKLANPFTWIIVALGALILIIDDLVVYMQGGETAFGTFWAKFGTGAEIAEKVSKAWAFLKEIFITAKDAIKDAITGTVELIKDIAQWVEKLWSAADGSEKTLTVFSALGRLCGAVWELTKKLAESLAALCTWLGELWTEFDGDSATAAVLAGALDLVATALNVIAEAIEYVVEHWGDIGAAAVAAVDALKTAWNNIPEWFSNIWQSCIGKVAEWKDALTASVNAAIEAIKAPFIAFRDWIVEIWDAIVAKITAAIDAIAKPVQWAKDTVKGVADFLGVSNEENEKAQANIEEKRAETLNKPAQDWTSDDFALMSTAVAAPTVDTAKPKANEAEQAQEEKRGWFSWLKKGAETVPTDSQIVAAPAGVSNITNSTQYGATSTDNRVDIKDMKTVNINLDNPEQLGATLRQMDSAGYDVSKLNTYVADTGVR